MSEQFGLTKLEKTAVTAAAVLVLGPLIMAPPFTSLCDGALSRDKISYNYEYQQIGDWILSMGAVTDWLLVAVGILQWRVYRQTAVILREQTAILNRQSNISKWQTDIQVSAQRPNIFVKGIDIKKISKDEGRAAIHAFQATWKNTGQISPRSLKIADRAKVLEMAELPTDFDYSVTLRPTVPIGRDMENKSDPHFLTDAEMLSLLTGQKRLFFWGCGEYVDELTPNIVHCVEFCYRTNVRDIYMENLPYGPHNRAYDRARKKGDHETSPMPETSQTNAQP